MRILIIGGNGMLGHQVFINLSKKHNTRVTLRNKPDAYADSYLFDSSNSYFNVDLNAIDKLEAAINGFKPEVVINAAGIVKQRKESYELVPSLNINSLLPHRLSWFCHKVNARFIHMSTDCVFSGTKGNYSETDFPDANDLYGKSKLLGEVDKADCITLRTSLIGWELYHKRGLLEWFYSQEGVVKGFKEAIFSGFTTIEICRIIEKIIMYSGNIAGIYHVSSSPISKFELLTRIQKKLNLPVTVVPDETVQYDRTLNSNRFRDKFMYVPPSWDSMIDELTAVKEAS